MHVPQTEVILRHEGVELAHVTLPPGEYVIGRAPEVAIHADTPLLSRRHARLTIDYDQLFLQDLGSSNGTFVNEQPATESTRLFPNQPLRLGNVELEVRRQRAPSEAGVSLAPAQAAIRRFLPDEILAERRYAIGSQIARGGMGAILDARQTAIQRQVAMKVMLGAGDEGDVLRFIEEAQITGQLDHPNIVPIYELGVDEQDQLFYTMKLVRGITLKKVLELLAQGVEATVKKYPLPTLLTIFQKVCDAVAFAHSKGVIHRDLKPENIMLGDYGSVLVMDWGLAKRIVDCSRPAGPIADFPPRAAAVPGQSPIGNRQSAMTVAGTIMGTPTYMSPEQARGEVDNLDNRSDLYALGAILYEILALRPPVTGQTAIEVVDKVGRGEVEPLINRQLVPRDGSNRQSPPPLPSSLAAVVGKAMAFARDQRYWTVEELQADLTAYQSGFATRAERASAWKQIALLIKRHKATSVGIAAVLLVGLTLGTKAVLEGRRAEREAVRAKAEARRAEQALADLRKTAPTLLALAESEAGLQRFDSAVEKLDAALALDPTLTAGYWRRGWIFLAQEKLPEAIAALRIAVEKDPANPRPAQLLPLVEKMAAAPVDQRHKLDVVRPIQAQLAADGARGEAQHFVPYITLDKAARLALVQKQVEAWLGKSPPGGVTPPFVMFGPDHCLEVGLFGLHVKTLEPLRGLPIENLDISYGEITDLAPLRGMPLRVLRMHHNPVVDVGPLAGLPLENLFVKDTQVSDLSPLHGLPLKDLNMENISATDLSPLAGLPLQHFTANNPRLKDFSALRRMPLTTLTLLGTGLSDGRILSGMPLESLNLTNSPLFHDLAPLAGLPLRTLNVSGCTIEDFSPLLKVPSLQELLCMAPVEKLLPLREHPGLQLIRNSTVPARPVAEFWAAYDEQKQKAAPSK